MISWSIAPADEAGKPIEKSLRSPERQDDLNYKKATRGESRLAQEPGRNDGAEGNGGREAAATVVEGQGFRWAACQIVVMTTRLRCTV
jgi:hypothetical protein